MSTLGTARRRSVKAALPTVLVGPLLALSVSAGASTAGAATPVAPLGTFSYGFAFSNLEPDLAPGNNPAAVISARAVMSSMPMLEAASVVGWGSGDPNPAPGVYDWSQLDERINLITSTGGTPVIELCGAPAWMRLPGQGQFQPPTAAHFEDFAHFAALAAQRYPQVKYFAVWKEMSGFFIQTGAHYDMASYMQMYNDVYEAIKAVRPDALVGGPYATLTSFSKYHGGGPSGPWGYAGAASLALITYFLQNAVGADFVAVGGRSYTQDKGLVTDPVNSLTKFAAMDAWLKTQTNLPIYWMESPEMPFTDTWSDQEGTAVRVAAEEELAASGATVALQWQPQEGSGFPDEGLWTAVMAPGGGQPTPLAEVMPSVLPVLARPVQLVNGEPYDVIVVSGAGGTVVVNGNPTASSATLGAVTVPLGPWAVTVVPGLDLVGSASSASAR
jgi:hypothetical protein